MLAFLQGIQTGLLLCIMLGPIFFALIQTGVETGMRAGMMVGLGVWISDLLFIISVFFGVSLVMELMEWDGFMTSFGIIGGILLIVFGVGTLMTDPPPLPPSREKPAVIKAKTYLGFWVKGFLINTINPFTFFFWLSVMSLVVLGEHENQNYAGIFFLGVMLTIVVTDILKVALAKHIRQYLTDRHLVWIRWLSGGALIVFGIALMVKVLL